MPSLFYAGQPDYIEKLNTLATAASMTNGTVAASFLSLAVTGTATAASFVGPLTGNASTATTLATARNINGVAFNGSADITVTAAAGTLTGATLAAGVTASSLTSVGALTSLTVAGSVGLGAAPIAGYKVIIAGTASGGTSTFAIGNIQAVDPTVSTALHIGFQTSNSVSAGTLPDLRGYNASQGVFTGSVTNQYGFYAQGTLTGATNNYGFFSNIASGSGRWNFFAAGTAANYFQGATTFADTLTVTGQASFATGTAAAPSVKVGAGNDGLYSLASGSLGLAASGRIALRLETVTNSVNYLYGYANATGGAPALRSIGTDTDVSLVLGTQGAGAFEFLTHGALTRQFRILAVPSAVNYWQAQGQSTGQGPVLFATGSDASVSALYVTKGSGIHAFYTDGGTTPQLLIARTANAVNYAQVTGSATGLGVVYGANGSDANVGAVVTSKGSASVGIYTGSGTSPALLATHTASGVNWVQTTGSTTGNAVSMTAGGSDANIDFLLGGKGTGVLRFGAHSALAAETVTGYITIKDSAGNTRKLAVLS